MNCWKILKLKTTSDIRAIKKAYAKLLKENGPEDNTAEFQQLREAYEQALTFAEAAAASNYSADVNNPGKLDTEPSPLKIEFENSFSDFTLPINSATDDQTLLSGNALVIESIKKIENVLHKQGQHAAILEFRAICQLETMESLDNLYEFEAKLLLYFFYSEHFYQDFLTEVANHFHWLKSDNPFRYDSNFNYAYAHVNRLVKIAMLKHKIAVRFPGLQTEQQNLLDKILFDEVAHELITQLLASGEGKLWYDILLFICQHEYDRDDSPVSNQVFKWYSENANLKNWLDQSWHRSQFANSDLSRKTRHFWLLFWALIWFSVILYQTLS